MFGEIISFGVGFVGGWIGRGLYDDSVSAEVLGLKDGTAYRRFEGAALAGRSELEKAVGKEGSRKAPLWTVPGMKEYFPQHITLPTVKSASPKGDVFVSASPDAMQFLFEQGLVTEEQAKAAGCNVKKPEEPKDELSAAEVEIIQKYRASQAEKAAKKAEKAA